MKKLELSDIANAAFSGTGIGEKNTVSSGPDDGTNNCQASHWWNVKRHSSTVEAVDNIINAAIVNFSPPAPDIKAAKGLTSTGAANIVGHGNEGQLETGMGQTGPVDYGKVIVYWNDYNWGPQFDRFKTSPVTFISIWACHPGAGPDGAEFVYRLAQHSDRAVRAGTGFLYCASDKIYWENGSVWQVGTPNHKPDPIAAPSPHSLTSRLNFEDGGNVVDVDDLVEMRIESRLGLTTKTTSATISGQEVAMIAARVFRSDPIDLMGVGIPAMVTAKMELTFKSEGRESFTVYNDRLARNDRTGTAYYIGSLSGLQG